MFITTPNTHDIAIYVNLLCVWELNCYTHINFLKIRIFFFINFFHQ